MVGAGRPLLPEILGQQAPVGAKFCIAHIFFYYLFYIKLYKIPQKRVGRDCVTKSKQYNP